MVAQQPGDELMASKHIPWFNPREMDDATVLALSTGREALLTEIETSIRQRIAHPGHNQNWLVTGMRGAGKSYFLRLLQASFNTSLADQARFVLLPEELPNIYAPHELLSEIQRLMQPQHLGHAPQFRTDNRAQLWDTALSDLLNSFSEPLLVVGVENFDRLLAQAFENDEDNSRLRHLLSNQPRIQWVVTAVQGDFDQQYHQRLFRQFEHRNLPRWDTDDHRDYLKRRAALQNQRASAEQLNRIDAYSRYTGGNARTAAILAASILDTDDAVLAAHDLDAVIEKMTDYYRALIDRIPIKTRKLFDALVRGGEPASQTAIAERTAAKQSDISRAFLWLVDNGYVLEQREPGQKAKSYRVADRLLVQFYRMRYLQPGQRSRLAILADLLAETLSFDDKWRLAERYLQQNAEDAQVMADLIYQERKIDMARLPNELREARGLIATRELWRQHEAIAKLEGSDNKVPALKTIFTQYPDDASFKIALDHARNLAKASYSADGNRSCTSLIEAFENSLAMSPADLYQNYCMASSNKLSTFQVDGFEKILTDEVILLERLYPTHEKSIDEFRAVQELGRLYPRTVSLLNVGRDRVNNFHEHLISLQLAETTDWLAQAILGLLQAGYSRYIEQALDSLFKAYNQSVNTEFSPALLLSAFQRLMPYMSQISTEWQAPILEAQGLIHEQLGDYTNSYQAHKQAQKLRLSINQPSEALWNQEKRAWCASAQGLIETAQDHHQQALAERLKQSIPYNVAWNIGQLARLACLDQDMSVVWQELDQTLLQTPGHEPHAINQLGDAVADRVKQHGEAAAFALGAELLQELAKRPQYPAEAVLRNLWIDMLEESVPFSLLRDLLDEWPKRWPIEQHPAIHELKAILTAWLDDLQAPAAERESRRKRLDPDLATTLDGLAEALSPKTRHRLGLLVTSD